MRATVLLALLLAGSNLSAQTVRVELDVDDSGTNGLIRGVITNALLAYGDISIVSSSQKSDYVIHAVVMCTPDSQDCARTTGYLGYMNIAESATRGDARVLAELGLPEGVRATSDQIDRMLDYISAYEIPRLTWIFNYGTNSYDQSIRSLLSKANSKCFERIRIRLRNPQLSYSELTTLWEGAGAICRP